GRQGVGPPRGFGGFGAFRGGGLGALLDAGTPSAALVALLEREAGAYRWVAATVGANSAAGIQLAAREPVLAIGGFNGTDPAPTLAQFRSLVAAGKIHWFLRGGRGFGGSADSNAIESWVTETFHAQSVGGVSVYDLTNRSG